MSIEISDIIVGRVFIEDLNGHRVVVKETQPKMGDPGKREVYLESLDEPGCGVWQDAELFASIHSKLPTEATLVEKKGVLTRFLRRFRF